MPRDYIEPISHEAIGSLVLAVDTEDWLGAKLLMG
jgi:hypothetical protein